MSECDSLRQQLQGAYSHAQLLDALEGLDLGQAGAVPEGLPHSIFQLLRHMIYWQDLGIARMQGVPAPTPGGAADGWTAPHGPQSDAEWSETIDDFATGLWEMDAMLQSPEVDLDQVVEPARRRTVRDNLLMVMCHNSYHLGEIVQLRRRLGAWPPPKGGGTW